LALITGGARGIGACCANVLKKKGYLVVVADIDPHTLTAFEQQTGMPGVQVNVADYDDVERMRREVEERFGPIDILVNNAGITRDNLLMRMKEDEWDSVLNTNLSSVYRVAKGCLRGMTKSRWGRIINVSSVVASMGNAGQSNYAAAKSGIEGFSRALAREVASRNITVNSVAPGFIDTDMTSGLAEEHKDKLRSQIPMNRLGDPKEVASVVGFLASDAGAYVTGETIHVNGGMYMS